MASVANDVHHDVPLELLAKLKRQLGTKTNRLGIVAIHVKNRRLDHLCHIRAVLCASRVRRQRGESDLIVRHDMDRPAHAITLELRHVQHFRDDSLPRERRVAVDQNRHNLRALRRIAANPLPRARRAHHNRIHGFEMARIRRKPHLHFRAAGLDDTLLYIAEVILHIAVAEHRIGNVIRIEFLEHHRVRLLQKFHNHREPPAMRHSHANLLHAKARAILQHTIKRRNKRFAALDAEPLHAKKSRVQKLLEGLHFHQVPQHPRPRLCIQRPSAPRLDPLAQPVSHTRILDVHIFKADLARINRFQLRHHVAQLHRLSAEEEFRRNDKVHVLFFETEFPQREQLMFRRRFLQGIRPRVQMPQRAIAVNKPVHAGLQRAIAPGRSTRNSAVLLRGLNRAQLETLEKCSEGRLHGQRVALPARIGVVEDVGIKTGSKSDGHKSKKIGTLLRPSREGKYVIQQTLLSKTPRPRLREARNSRWPSSNFVGETGQQDHAGSDVHPTPASTRDAELCPPYLFPALKNDKTPRKVSEYLTK